MTAFPGAGSIMVCLWVNSTLPSASPGSGCLSPGSARSSVKYRKQMKLCAKQARPYRMPVQHCDSRFAHPVQEGGMTTPRRHSDELKGAIRRSQLISLAPFRWTVRLPSHRKPNEVMYHAKLPSRKHCAPVFRTTGHHARYSRPPWHSDAYCLAAGFQP